jgi:Ion channel
MRFSILLFSLLLLALLNPLLEEIGLVKAQILLNISFTLVLISGIYAISRTKRALIIVLFMASVPLILMWLKPYFPTWNVQLTLEIILATYFLVIAIVVLTKVIKNERVTWEKISAALCVYLLIGMVWAFLYSISEKIHPASFELKGVSFSQFVYYSMITLCTVGYGDITPLAPFVRALAYVEAITGQFYLTVLVARLVGLHIVHESEQNARSL